MQAQRLSLVLLRSPSKIVTRTHHHCEGKKSSSEPGRATVAESSDDLYQSSECWAEVDYGVEERLTCDGPLHSS
jgi:hypothetical protein